MLMTDVNSFALEKALSKVKELVPTGDGRLETKVVDVSKEADIEAAVNHLDSWGGVDVMFNNAGIMHPKDGDAEECPNNIWDLTMNINVKGVWYGSKHAVRSMRKHDKKKASVINTASMVALVGAATPQLSYTASKGAVLAMTRELAIVHAREGFRFNSLCPAPLKYELSPYLRQTSEVMLIHDPARPCSRNSSVTTRKSGSVAKCTSPAAASARLSSRRRRWCSWPAMRAVSSMLLISWLMAA